MKLTIAVHYNTFGDSIDIETKTILKDTREALESAAELVAETISKYGFLDDDDPKVWKFIPTHSIRYVKFTFQEDD